MSAASLPPGVGSASARWLFSAHFLSERLRDWPEFAGLDTTALHGELRELWEREGPTLRAGANEGVTEERFIRSVLKSLGHAFTLFPEIPGAGKTPDYLFYATEADRSAAELGSPAAKVERALAVGDAKRFDLPLDRRTPDGASKSTKSVCEPASADGWITTAGTRSAEPRVSATTTCPSSEWPRRFKDWRSPPTLREGSTSTTSG